MCVLERLNETAVPAQRFAAWMTAHPLPAASHTLVIQHVVGKWRARAIIDTHRSGLETS